MVSYINKRQQKQMQIQSLAAAEQTLSLLLKKTAQQLKVKQLVKCLPQFNQEYVSKMANAGAGTVYMPSPNLRYCYLYGEIHEDQFPNNIPIDQLANFEIRVESNAKNSRVAQEKQVISNTYQTTRLRRTGQNFRGTARTKKSKQPSTQQNLNKYLVIPPNENNNLTELPVELPSKEEADFQLELRALQKKLYFTRKAKKLQEEQELQRINALKNRKSPERPKGDFTYQTNGEFIKRKPFKSDQLLAQQMKHSQSFDFKPKDKKPIDEILQQAEEIRGRSQLQSRFQKSSIFNNSNKRQVSHLPFIKMSQNSRMKQDNRNSQGNKTERLSLKTFSQSLEQKGFKHHSEIQRQRKQRELIARLQAQRLENKEEEIGKNPQEPEDGGYNNLMRRRHSYMLNKYLKKLKDQTGDENRKSLNFNGVSFPKHTAIHSYYKHNFNEERKFYESEVISRVLDNTPKNQHSNRY